MLFVAWLAVLKGALEPPALTSDMARVLLDGGRTLREEIIARVPRRSTAFADSVVLLAGLSRRCYPAVVRAALDECGRRNATLVALLQHYAPGDFPADIAWTTPAPRAERIPESFEACAALFEHEAAREGNGGCALVLGRQHFNYTPARHSCHRDVGPGVIHNQPRAMIQTLALGRAYEWGLAAEPRARLFVRARLDLAIAIPVLPPGLDLNHELLTSHVQEDVVLGGVFVGDVACYAGAAAARVYFGAWRVWRPMVCEAVCHAGTVSHRTDATKPMLAKACTGEVQLSKWLAANGVRPTGVVGAHMLRQAAADADENVARVAVRASVRAYCMEAEHWREDAHARLPEPTMLACGARARVARAGTGAWRWRTRTQTRARRRRRPRGCPRRRHWRGLASHAQASCQRMCSASSLATAARGEATSRWCAFCGGQRWSGRRRPRAARAAAR
jgi:hypothetical protein